MSVIAKVSIRNVVAFGSGSLIELGCVCNNDLMAAYAGSEEDRLFTKYSPWGEIKYHAPAGWMLGEVGDEFYVLILNKDECPDGVPVGAQAFSSLRVASVTDFGDNQAKRLEMTDVSQRKDDVRRGIDKLNWKMSVDNPPVFAQLRAGVDSYTVAFYPASLGRDGAIAAAHERQPC